MNESDLAEDGIYLDDDLPDGSGLADGERGKRAGAPQSSADRLMLWLQLARYAQRYPRELWLIAVLAIATAAVDLCFPLITRVVIDAVAESNGDKQTAKEMTVFRRRVVRDLESSDENKDT